jgi:hypothetical protein
VKGAISAAIQSEDSMKYDSVSGLAFVRPSVPWRRSWAVDSQQQCAHGWRDRLVSTNRSLNHYKEARVTCCDHVKVSRGDVDNGNIQ